MQQKLDYSTLQSFGQNIQRNQTDVVMKFIDEFGVLGDGCFVDEGSKRFRFYGGSYKSGRE